MNSEQTNTVTQSSHHSVVKACAANDFDELIKVLKDSTDVKGIQEQVREYTTKLSSLLFLLFRDE